MPASPWQGLASPWQRWPIASDTGTPQFYQQPQITLLRQSEWTMDAGGSFSQRGFGLPRPIMQSPPPTQAIQADYDRSEYKPIQAKQPIVQFYRQPSIVQAREAEWTPDRGSAWKQPFVWGFGYNPRGPVVVVENEWVSGPGSVAFSKPTFQAAPVGVPFRAVEPDWTPAPGSVIRFLAPFEQIRLAIQRLATTEDPTPYPGSAYRFTAPLPGIPPFPGRLIVQSEFTLAPGSASIGKVPGFGPPYYRSYGIAAAETLPLLAGSAFWHTGLSPVVLAQFLKAYAAQIGVLYVSGAQTGVTAISAAQAGTLPVPGQVGE